MRTNDTDQKPCQVTCPYSEYHALVEESLPEHGEIERAEIGQVTLGAECGGDPGSFAGDHALHGRADGAEGLVGCGSWEKGGEKRSQK